MTKYIIKWKSRITGYEGGGVKPVEIKSDTVRDQIAAYAFVNKLDKEFSNIRHWLEEVKQ